MKNVEHLNSVGNLAVEDEVVVETRDAEGPYIPQAEIAKRSPDAKFRVGSERGKGLARRFKEARRGIGIVLGDELPDRPKLILNARVEDKFTHGRDAP